MDLLRTLYPFVDLLAPLGWVALATAIGARFGARATMMVNLPLPIFMAHAIQLDMTDLQTVQTNALRTLCSLPMVYTWIGCWLLVAPWVERVLPDPPGSHRSAFLSSVGSVLLAWVVNVLALRPLLEAVPLEVGPRLALVALFMTAGTLVPLLAQRGEAPARADASLSNYLLRLVSIVLIVRIGNLLAETDALPTLRSLLDSFPRLTFEMVVGVQAAHGFRAGRQVLVGLPVGLAVPVGWCLLLIFGPSLVGAGPILYLTTGWVLLALGAAVALILRLERPTPAPPAA